MVVQVVPASTPTWAVLCDEEGNPDLRECPIFGVCEEVQNGMVVSRIATGFCAGEVTKKDVPLAKNPDTHIRIMGERSNLNPVCYFANFVTYAYSPDPEPWRERCKAKAAYIEKTAIELATRKIFVPTGKDISGLVKEEVH